MLFFQKMAEINTCRFWTFSPTRLVHD